MQRPALPLPLSALSPLAMVGLAAMVAAAGAARADSDAVALAPAGNGLNPATVIGSGERDPAGLGPFRQPASRTPGGLLYALPYAVREPQRGASGWELRAFVEAGFFGGDADERNALWRRTTDPAGGAALTRFDLLAYRPQDARYVEVFGGGVGRDDGYLSLAAGRYNQWQLQLDFSAVPHVASTTARPMWQGVGSGTLTLTPAPGVVAGGASANNAANAAAVAALVAQTPAMVLGVQRDSGAARLALRLAEGWTLSSSYTLERRHGARAFGGNEGNGELVEPVEQRTHELRAGLHYAADTTQLNAVLSASLFRNRIDTLSWQNPFRHPSGNLAILGGRADLAPDNDAWRARIDFAHAMPQWWRARFTAQLQLGSDRQNDRLIPPTVTSGVGAPFGSGFDGNFDRWNTTAALPRESALARIDSRLLDLGLTVSPLQRLTLRATLRHQATRNRTDYTAFNPLTGRFGYIIQDTNASRIYDGSNNVHYRSIPFDAEHNLLRLAAETPLRRRSVLVAEFEAETVQRSHRERERTTEQRLRLAYTDRSFDAATLRLHAEQSRRRGSDYVSNPYTDFYTASLPDYTVSRANLLDRLHNLEEMRKFDLADRDEQRLKARLNLLPRADLDLGIALQVRLAEHPAEFGRSGRQSQRSLTLDAGWLPGRATSLHAYFTRQSAAQQQRGAADLGSAAAAGCLALPPSCSNRFGAPGSIYPLELAWSASTSDRSSALGAALVHDFGRAALELQLARVRSRSPLAYAFASPAALQSPSFVQQAQGGLPDALHDWRSADASLRVPLTPAIALRFSWRHETVRIADWHYAGLEQGLVVGNRVYLDAGPQPYRVNVFGAFVQFSL